MKQFIPLLLHLVGCLSRYSDAFRDSIEREFRPDLRMVAKEWLQSVRNFISTTVPIDLVLERICASDEYDDNNEYRSWCGNQRKTLHLTGKLLRDAASSLERGVPRSAGPDDAEHSLNQAKEAVNSAAKMIRHWYDELRGSFGELQLDSQTTLDLLHEVRSKAGEVTKFPTEEFVLDELRYRQEKLRFSVEAAENDTSGQHEEDDEVIPLDLLLCITSRKYYVAALFVAYFACMLRPEVWDRQPFAEGLTLHDRALKLMSPSSSDGTQAINSTKARRSAIAELESQCQTACEATLS